jgi:hypothetical protein
MSATTHVIFLEHAHIYLVISTGLNHTFVITTTDLRIRLVARAARLTNYSLVHDDDYYCRSDRQVTDCADRNRIVGVQDGNLTALRLSWSERLISLHFR